MAIWDVFTAFNWMALGKQAVTAIGKGLTSAGKAIPNALKSLGKRALNAFKGVSWGSVGRTVVSLIGKGITALISLPSTLLRRCASLAMKAFTSIAWGTVGRNIVTGIARGITAGLSVIVNAARNAAQRALSAAKSFLGIQSPSKVFRDQVAKNISLGMAKGIEDAIPRVDRAMDKLNYSAISAMPMAIPSGDSIGMAGVSGGTQFINNITIEGASDPIETANTVVRQMKLELRTI